MWPAAEEVFKKKKQTAPKSRSNLGVKLTFTIGSVLFLLGAIGFLTYIIRKRRRDAQSKEESIGEVLAMPNRFFYDELKTATNNFNKKLGEGGFGAVFEGTLEDSSKIAIKCLEGLGQVNKSFLAEVQSIGGIHHVNLVRLRGYCSWKSQRFLVYEFMSNGSLGCTGHKRGDGSVTPFPDREHRRHHRGHPNRGGESGETPR
ncbi:putative protein kinase RLK-Pelle-SD-2b family [Helianthus anomalus]